MTRLSYIFVCFLLFLSCTSNTILEPPKDLIPKEKMISIFVDLQLAQAGKNVKNLSEKRNENYYQLVFEKYQLDTIKFKESNDYYASLIDEYHAMFVEVENRLLNLQDKYMDERDLEDSIKNADRKIPEYTPRERLKRNLKLPDSLQSKFPLRKDSLIQ